LVEPLVARFGERRVMLAGLGCGVASFAIYGFAATGLAFCLAIPINGLWGLAAPPMQGMMTRRVSASEQGQLQGALSSVRGIAFMIGPLVFTNIFAAFIGAERAWHLPGAPYLLAGVLLALATIVTWHTTAPSREAANFLPAEEEV
jgi:MFS transporter, DHA1 family, tetracycline resistance protein